MSRRTLIIIGIILVLLGIGVYIYFAYFRKTTDETPEFPPLRGFPTISDLPLQRTPEEVVPVAQPKKGGVLKVLVEEPVIGPALSREKSAVLFITRENGNIYRINFDGSDRSRISNQTLIGLYHTHWSPDKTKLFLAYERDDEIKKIILNLAGENPSSTAVSQETRSGTWSKDGKTFYALEEFDDGVRLIAADALNQKGKELLKIPLGDLNILSYVGNSAYFAEAPSGFVRGPLFEWNVKTGLFYELTNNFGLTALDSPEGGKILLSYSNAEGIMQNLKTFTVKDGAESLLFAKTLAEKCAFADENIIFCGVPKDDLSQTVMPDDYYKGLVETNDILVRIDTSNGSIQRYETEGFDRGLDIQDVFADTEGKYVFFRDKKTNFLYSFSLPE